jgi:hypothetical protein
MGLLLLATLNACGSSKSQNPVASSDEVGKVEDSQDKPTVYTARDGDTLRKIAGRPEIYGDPNLWPLIQEANADSVGQGMHVNKGTKLTIPRDMSSEQMEEAREKARQYSASSKMSGSSSGKHREGAMLGSKAEPTAMAPAAAPTAMPAQSAQPVPQAKKGSMLLPVLLILLLILAALAAVLFFFMKKDGKEDNPD